MLLLSDANFEIDLDEIEDFTMNSETGAGGPWLGAVTGGRGGGGEVRGGWRGGRGRGGRVQSRGRRGLLVAGRGGGELFHGWAGGGGGLGGGREWQGAH